ncbi:hypothetical protein GLW00_12420 [Halobacillus litoralis]|uniref:Uncharacterized protein n=1 Tax=Halobacillus litoralis TaxID=45668 RepID=A0A845FD14_9BACI|nr:MULTISPECIES: hypothetical protein [Halobacillus]MEC3884900.1 hypothetical protein [Halobacillus sp. HZG1]MYL71664.1 hypothetical protein [Halobacillus litoralis]
METIKKYLKPLFLAGILLLSVGCTNSEDAETHAEENGSEENIRTVLEHSFTGPDEEQEKLIEGPEGDVEEYAKELGDYREENFKPYMTERFFENYLVNTNRALMAQSLAHPNYTLSVEDIEMEEEEDYYTFTVEVSYMDNESNESKTVNVEGHAQTNEEDKLTSIQYSNFEDLRTALE